jgi:ERCC4-type nuclease
VATLHHNWAGKKWSRHGAHEDIYTTVPRFEQKKAGFIKPKINLVVKMAAQIDQIHKKAFDIGKTFKTPLEMVTASEGRWANIDGIGRKSAKRIRQELGHAGKNL